MSEARRSGARKVWFQIHKWIGLILAALIIPLSLSGSALVWHDWVDETLNPQRYPTAPVERTLAPSAYADAAREVLKPGALISAVRYPGDTGLVTVSALDPRKPGAPQGPPARTTVWLDPASAQVIDSAGSNEGFVRAMHVLHGSFFVPGWGRQLVGWLGVAMLLSCISGLWIWWPTIGKWTRGLRWRRQPNFDANLHHQFGFWILIPLAMLSFTGVWISFPQFFAGLTGSGAQQGRAMAERQQRMRARPLETPRLSADAALAAASGGKPLSITFPTDRAPEWKLSLAPVGKGKPAEVAVDDVTGAVERAKGGDGNRNNQGIARTMRRLHDGTDMGVVWQIVIFIGGIIPAALAVTGVIMWWRARGWRGDLAARQKARRRDRVSPAEA